MNEKQQTQMDPGHTSMRETYHRAGQFEAPAGNLFGGPGQRYSNEPTEEEIAELHDESDYKPLTDALSDLEAKAREALDAAAVGDWAKTRDVMSQIESAVSGIWPLINEAGGIGND